MNNNMETWNEICYSIKELKRRDVSEREFQTAIEFIFEKLGWSRYRKEIDSLRNIPIGSANYLTPDIIIRDNNTDIIEYCNNHIEEFQNLLRKDYSKEMFDVNFAFFIKESEIDYSNSDKKRNYTKFWKQIHIVHGERVLITSQWFRGSRKYFDKYIELKGLKA